MNRRSIISTAAIMGLVLALAPGSFVSPSGTSAGQDPPAGDVERWKGTIQMGPLTVDFVASFKRDDQGRVVSGTIDVPVQGLKGTPLTEISMTDQVIQFTFRPPGAPIGATFKATPSEDGRTASGTLEQAGQAFNLQMERVTQEEAAAVGPRRPQTPKPPFPYAQRDVSYVNPKDETRLAGTLTIPEGDGPHPVALMITGSGAQDRDETILGHKPFMVIADHLTRRGVAVLRVDDRGVGGSTGSVSESTSESFATDVLAGVAFLKNQSEIDAKRIGLIGHSEGGMIAPMVAARSSDVAFVVLLSGPGLPGGEILVMQLEAILRAGGVGEESVRSQIQVQKAAVALLKSGAEESQIREQVKKLVELQTVGRPIPPEVKEAQIDLSTRQLASPWFRSFVSLDPRESLRKVKCPVLALNGTLDLQVPYEVNLGAIRKALTEGGNEDITTLPLRSLNHLFQHASTGLINEYITIEETFSPEALEMISSWIRKRTGLAR